MNILGFFQRLGRALQLPIAVLPVAALLGALFLVWVDVAARTWLAPQDLPIGIVTAAIGGAFFVALLRRR